MSKSEGEKDFNIGFDDEAAICTRPDGSTERVLWTNIVKVTIEATAGEIEEAPAHIWILWGRDNLSGCIYPGGATGAELMLLEMKTRLKSFDIGAVATAMKSDENNTWLLWQAEGEGVNTPEDGSPPPMLN